MQELGSTTYLLNKNLSILFLSAKHNHINCAITFTSVASNGLNSQNGICFKAAT